MNISEEYFGVGKARVSEEARRRYLRRRATFLETLEKRLYDPASPFSKQAQPVHLSSGESAFLHPVGDTGTGYLVVCNSGQIRYFFGTGGCFQSREISAVAEASTFPVDRKRLIWCNQEFGRFYSAISTTIGEVIQDALVSRHTSHH